MSSTSLKIALFPFLSFLVLTGIAGGVVVADDLSDNINDNDEADAPPNIILLMSDDVGWGDHSYNCDNSTCSSNDEKYCCAKTPNLDKMAHGSNSLLFHRFYAGSACCSPTRAAVLTGRAPQRSCVDSAGGCGQLPAWKCHESHNLPWNQFTVANAVKKSKHDYSTFFMGKWHLGDFWNKKAESTNYSEAGPSGPQPPPYAHPGQFGFDTWYATEASASSSMLNCGCFQPVENCDIGGGVLSPHDSFPCTNYWYNCGKQSKYPTGVCNITEKEMGDDNEFVMDKFNSWLDTTKAGKAGSPFLALLWLHTVHVPHPAMPEWYNHATFPKKNGDYQGTIEQMDSQIGHLRQILKTRNIASNTMLWYTSDNGPHKQSSATGVSVSGYGPDGKLFNGLRQCKGSIFEGGVRVPGILEWPNMIDSSRSTWMPAGVFDYLPTILDVLDVKPDNQSWPLDGISLMPLIKGTMDSRKEPYGLIQHGGAGNGNSKAWIQGDLKLLYNPGKGQCGWIDKIYSDKSASDTFFLFNLTSDLTESHDLSKQMPTQFQQMKDSLAKWEQSISISRVQESACASDTPEAKQAYNAGLNMVNGIATPYSQDVEWDSGVIFP